MDIIDATSVWGGWVRRRFVNCLLLTVATASCAGSASQRPSTTAAPHPVSFDGRYVGTMRVTGTAMGVRAQECETSPRISIDVRNNQFTLTQPPPNAAAATPSLRDQATRVYSATIQSDGTIAGTSDQSTATMDGHATGARLSGNIYGLLCYYEYSADRV